MTKSNEAVRAWSVDAIAAVFLLVLVAVGKHGIVNLPYYWDEMSAYIDPAIWLAKGSLLRAFPGNHPPSTFFGHPFAIYLILAALFKMFGDSIWVSHVFILTVSFIGLFYTYLLGKHLHNSTVGITASVLLLFSPLFFAQSGMVNGDTVLTSIGVVTVYYFIKRQYLPYLLSGTLLVLCKESSAAFIVAMLLVLCVDQECERPSFKLILKYSVPLLLLCLFFIAQKITTGMLLPNAYFGSHNFFDTDLATLWNKFLMVLYWSFLSQYKALLLIAIAVNFVIYRGRSWKKGYLLFSIISLFFIATYTGIFFLPRYIMPILPYFFIAGVASTQTIFSFKSYHILVLAVVLFMSVRILHGNGANGGSNETDMQYEDVVTIHKAACNYLKSNYPHAIILTNWPFTSSLLNPQLGYVTNSIKTTTSPKRYDVLLYSPQSDHFSSQTLEGIIAQDRLRLLKKFEQGGKSVYIYSNRPLSYGNAVEVITNLKGTEADPNSSMIRGGNGWVIESKSDDPRLILPYSLDNKPKLLKVVITSSTNTFAQVYFKTTDFPDFTEGNSMKQGIKAGDNTVYFYINTKNTAGEIRLDPGASKGKYIIKSIEVSEPAESPTAT